MKLAIFASGIGSNFMAIKDAIDRKSLSAEIAFVFCDKPGAKVIERAKQAGILCYTFEPKSFESKELFEKKIVDLLIFHNIDLVVLAGYMRLVGNTLLIPFRNRIVNIHPSMLPAYPGTKSIQEAFNDHIPFSGVTVHFIDEGIDTGPIIAQEKVMRAESDSLDSFERRIHEVEHNLYPRVIQQIIQERG